MAANEANAAVTAEAEKSGCSTKFKYLHVLL